MNHVRAMSVAVGAFLLPGATIGAQTTIDTQGAFPIGFFAGGQTAIGESFTAPNNLYMQSASLWLGGIGVSFSGYLQAFTGSATGVGPISLTGPQLYVSAPRTLNSIGPVRVDFSLPNTLINAGAQYAFFVAATTGQFASYGPLNLDTYSGGSAVYATSGLVPNQQTNVDLGFIARFDGATGPVTSTPEPASLALVATGLLAVVGVARGRGNRTHDQS